MIGDARPYRFISAGGGGGGGGGSSSEPDCVVDLFSSPKPGLCDKAILCWWLVVRGCFAPFQDSIEIGNHDSVGVVAATRHLLCEFDAGRTGEKGRKLCFPKGSDDDANVPQSKHPDLFVVEHLTFHKARFQIFFLFPHEAKLYNASHKDHSIGPAHDNASSHSLTRPCSRNSPPPPNPGYRRHPLPLPCPLLRLPPSSANSGSSLRVFEG